MYNPSTVTIQTRIQLATTDSVKIINVLNNYSYDLISLQYFFTIIVNDIVVWP
jgi:hypothetical protein